MIKALKNLKESGDFKSLLFHTSWALTITSGLSYFFGLLRDRIFAHTFGLSRELDVYNAAFVIPDLLLSVLIGTALSAAFLPIFTKQYDKKKQLGYQYAHQIFTWGILILTTIAILIAITLPLFAHRLVPGFGPEALKQYILLTRVLLFSPIIFTLSNVYGRILLTIKEFFWYGLSPALYNLGIIIGVIFFVPKFGLIGLIFGTVLGAFMHLAIRLGMTMRREPTFKPKFDLSLSAEIKETAKLTTPKIAQYLMWHVMLISFTSIASKLPEGSIAVYNYARNFMSLPVSMLGIAIAMALYTSLSHDAAKGHFTKFKRDFRRDRFRSFTYTTLAAIGLTVLARPIIGLLLGGGEFTDSDVHLLATTLQIYCIAIPLESLLHIYHRAYYSLRNTIIPSLFHTFNLLLAILLANFLAPQIGVYAIPIGFTVGTGIHVLILSIIFPFLLRRRTLAAEQQSLSFHPK